jgi:hypothetical protein
MPKKACLQFIEFLSKKTNYFNTKLDAKFKITTNN